MLTLCFGILYISGPGYNAWLSRSTFANRSTSSSFGFGLFPTYHEVRLPGKSLFLIQVKIMLSFEYSIWILTLVPNGDTYFLV